MIPNKIELEQLKKVISSETLTIKQLIGFNFKQAIGEPLTLLTRKTIESRIPMDPKTHANYLLTMANLAMDEKTTKRYFELIGEPVPKGIKTDNN